MKEPNFQATQWIAWLGATATAAVTLTVFAFENFETKEHAKEAQVTFQRQFDRLESKVDELLKFQREENKK